MRSGTLSNCSRAEAIVIEPTSDNIANNTDRCFRSFVGAFTDPAPATTKPITRGSPRSRPIAICCNPFITYSGHTIDTVVCACTVQYKRQQQQWRQLNDALFSFATANETELQHIECRYQAFSSPVAPPPAPRGARNNSLHFSGMFFRPRYV